MEAFFDVFDTTDKILLAAGIVLILLATLQPSRLPGIGIDWVKAKAAIALVVGIALLALSFHQVRAYLIRDKVVILKDDFDKLQTELGEALIQAQAARTSSGDGGQCAGYGRAAHIAITHAIDITKKAQ